MCIIAIKPAGVPMPSKAILKECWSGNSDGAGVAFYRPGDNAVTIEKGFMKLKKFMGYINHMDFGINDIVVMHYRYATHGLKDEGNCHPFPLTKDHKELRATMGSFPVAIAHNGVFHNMASHDTLSDTQKFISGVLANEAIINNIDNKAVQELISGYCGSSSKLAILKPNRLLMIGDFIEDNGIYYSNHGYKVYTPVIHNHAYNNWDDEYMPAGKPASKLECLLCNSTDEVFWLDEEDAFVCSQCIKLNLMGNCHEDNDCKTGKQTRTEQVS